MKVYLAGPINKCADAQCKGWREEFKGLVKGIVDLQILDPMRRDYRGKEDKLVDQIVEGDKDDITESDTVVANVNKPSFGTAMEIIFAWENGKNIILITEDDKPSPWLVYHSDKIVKTLAEAVALLTLP